MEWTEKDLESRRQQCYDNACKRLDDIRSYLEKKAHDTMEKETEKEQEEVSESTSCRRSIKSSSVCHVIIILPYLMAYTDAISFG